MAAEAIGADAVLGRLLLAFAGTDLPPAGAALLRDRPAAGVALYRHLNVSEPPQLRALTDAIQRLAPPGLPFLVAIDQEGGQLLGLGPASTGFAGNMALGAVADDDLAERVGEAIGLELLACGVNVNFAPVCDLATNPANRSLGVRSFGDDPARVGALVAATVRGMARAGVASTLKHFPGLGDAAVDSHHGLATVDASAEQLHARELEPFRAGIAAGAELVMSAHLAVPGVTGDPAVPATLSPVVMGGLLRDALGFEGVTLSDAFDMGGLGNPKTRPALAGAALSAGIDLILAGPADADGGELQASLEGASAAGLVDPERTARALGRVIALRRRVARVPRPDPSVVGGAAHRALATELAERALTLVRDDAALLPLAPSPDETVGVVTPRPANLTPADTSSAVAAGLAAAIRRRHPRVIEVIVEPDPDEGEIARAMVALAGADLLVVGTAGASFLPGQAEFARALLGLDLPTVTVALRTPWDLATYPRATTHVCTYSILEPSVEALAGAIFGERGFPGSLPVAIGNVAR